MAQCIDMRDAEPVYVGADIVTCGFVAGNPALIPSVTRGEHMVLSGKGCLGAGLQLEIMGQTDTPTLAHFRGGASGVLRAQMIERSAFVLIAPASPIGERIE